MKMGSIYGIYHQSPSSLAHPLRIHSRRTHASTQSTGIRRMCTQTRIYVLMAHVARSGTHASQARQHRRPNSPHQQRSRWSRVRRSAWLPRSARRSPPHRRVPKRLLHRLRWNLHPMMWQPAGGDGRRTRSQRSQPCFPRRPRPMLPPPAAQRFTRDAPQNNDMEAPLDLYSHGPQK
jgi:hypothetical protein